MWDELSHFLSTQDSPVEIWWRDDDATQDGEALQAYLQALPDVPILLAVIANEYDSNLVAKIKSSPHIRIAQHGFAHSNHASADEKKNEYPKTRSTAEVKTEWQTGRAKLQKDFGKQFLPVFVPPWNRMDDKFLSNLIPAGFKGLSMFKGKNQKYPLQRRDSHIDIINWKQGKSFIGIDNFITQLIDEIRTGTHPIGILTHHKIHDKATNSFLLDFYNFIKDNQKFIKIIKPPFAK